ncbi:hypothetical protein ACIQVT_00560 [Streptomyces sp. NPDC100445]|uniref:hypothetical protein n=1 Tax=Streptomyces sp. NPDC100445 TaxID=3366102 RepID=UPI0038088E4F
MRKTIAPNTEPHVIAVGPHELEFLPEVYGAEFIDAYEELQEAQAAKGVDLEDLEAADPTSLRKTIRAVRVFLARQMLPDSAERFLRLDVIVDGNVLESFQDADEAAAFAAEHPGAQVQDALRLPVRSTATRPGASPVDNLNRSRRAARGPCTGMARERVRWPSVVDRAREGG